MEGKGRFKHATNEVYEGDFLNNGAYGYGKFIRANGDIYEG